MTTRCKYIAICTIALLCCCSKSFGQTPEYIEYKDNYSSGNSFLPPTVNSRGRQATNHRPGKINVITGENWLNGLSDEQKAVYEASIKSATSIWELVLNGSMLDVEIEHNADYTCDVYTKVPYYTHENIAYPAAYYKNFINPESVGMNATIVINDETEWEVGYSGTNKNLTFALLRAIAHIMGFGSSLKLKENGDFVIQSSYFYSAFDHLIFSVLLDLV